MLLDYTLLAACRGTDGCCLQVWELKALRVSDMFRQQPVSVCVIHLPLGFLVAPWVLREVVENGTERNRGCVASSKPCRG